jgi:alkylhydroperoxidase family enzyme
VSDDAPRLAPLPEEQWDQAVKDALFMGFPPGVGDRFFSNGPDRLPIPNALRTMVRHPALAGPWLKFNGVLLYEPTLAPRLRELMVLRVAWRARAPYEWVQHVRLAPRCDISAEDVDAIADGADNDRWSPLEAAALRATDELLDDHCVSDATWAALAEHLDERQLVEAVYVVGTYTCLAMVFNSFGIQLDPELADVPAPRLPPRVSGS